jgi:hypothetical protein
MGKCSNDFFSETTNMITAKLYMKKRFETFPPYRNKNLKLVEDNSMRCNHLVSKKNPERY